MEEKIRAVFEAYLQDGRVVSKLERKPMNMTNDYDDARNGETPAPWKRMRQRMATTRIKPAALPPMPKMA